MVDVTFIDARGDRRCIDVGVGETLMAAAKAHGIVGIDADCGGYGACATCQVYIDDAWTDRTGAPGEDESVMLEITNARRANSRLSCQIVLDETLEGLVVTVPELQS